MTDDPALPSDLPDRITIQRTSQTTGIADVQLDDVTLHALHVIAMPGRRLAVIVPTALDERQLLIPAYAVRPALMRAIERAIRELWDGTAVQP